MGDDTFLREAAHAPSEPIEDLAGSSLGRYQITARLGSGGMGIVYRARDTVLRREVALKVLPPEVVGDPDRRQRLLREARLAAAVTHPCLVPIYDVGEESDRVYVAMELVGGRTIRDVLAGGALPHEEVVRIGTAVAGAVAAAHQAGIIDRDLKPENLMVTESGEPKVLDFGLAKTRVSPFASGDDLTKSAFATEAGGVLGTPAYMSPEQAKGLEVTEQSDVFSLGIVLYEMATGRRPFQGTTTVELLIAIDRDTPPPPRSVDATIPAELDGLILWCLNKQPSARPSARELVDALALRRPMVLNEAPERTGARPGTAGPGSGFQGNAMDLYLRARQDMRRIWHQLDLSGPIELLEAALALAPDEPLIIATYATALARTSIVTAGLLPQARAAASRALDLAPHLGEAWLARAIVVSHEGDHVAEASTLARGIAIAPSVAQLHWRAGQLLVQTGPIAAAERSLERARLLDPYDGEVIAGLARAAMFRGDLAACDRLMTARYDSGHLGMELQRARFALWRQSPELAETLIPDRLQEPGQEDALLAFIMLRACVVTKMMPDGIREGMRKDATNLSRPGGFPWRWQLLAEMEAYAGEHDGALGALEMATDAGLIDVVNLDSLELFAPLRTTPRWKALRERAGARADKVREALDTIAT